MVNVIWSIFHAAYSRKGEVESIRVKVDGVMLTPFNYSRVDIVARFRLLTRFRFNDLSRVLISERMNFDFIFHTLFLWLNRTTQERALFRVKYHARK